jgi:hypothetical protein
MARSKSIQAVSTWLREPLLIGSSCVSPLDYFCPTLPALPCDIKAQSIICAFYYNSFSLPLELPPLIPSCIPFPLNNSLARLPGGSRNIDSLASHIVHNYCTVFNGIAVIICGLLEPKKL